MRDRHSRHRIIRKNHREGLDIIRSCIDLLQKADERGSDKLIKIFPRFFRSRKINKIFIEATGRICNVKTLSIYHGGESRRVGFYFN